MLRIFTDLPATLISSISILLGAIVGGIFSWIITNKSTDKTIEVQNKIVEDNRKYAEDTRMRRSREYANIIRLDICTALFSSARVLQSFKNNGEVELYPVPMDREYSSGVAYLKNGFKLKELSYIYQLYGLIEKLNRDTNNFNYFDNKNYDLIKMDCQMFLKKLYGDNWKKILDVNIDDTCYEDLYDNDAIKEGYRQVLKKLDKICNID